MSKSNGHQIYISKESTSLVQKKYKYLVQKGMQKESDSTQVVHRIRNNLKRTAEASTVGSGHPPAPGSSSSSLDRSLDLSLAPQENLDLGTEPRESKPPTSM